MTESTNDIVWHASTAEIARSRTAAFMRHVGVDSYQELVTRSVEDIEWFWDAAVQFLGVPFATPYDSVLDVDRLLHQLADNGFIDT